MTTDLRAALREAAALLREDAQDHIDDARKQAAAPLLQMAERLEALADAPPTVAELLPLVDATHEVHASRCDVAIRFRLHRSARVPMPPVDAIAAERHHQGLWWPTRMLPSDLTQPATLVEVTP